MGRCSKTGRRPHGQVTSTCNKYLFLMTSREARQTYTGIHMPGERWREIHVHIV